MSITAVSVNSPSHTAFKGGIKRTENGIPYYKSNTGTTIGAVTGGIGALTWLAQLTQKDLNEEKSVQKWKDAGKTEEQINKLKDFIKKNNEDRAAGRKWAVPFAIIAGVTSLACGMLIDNLRNKKAKETQDIFAQTGPENAYMYGADYAPNGIPYYKSNQGAKYGAALGAVCGLTHGFMQHSVQKNYLQKMGIGKTATIINSVIALTLGGLGLGALTDNLANKKAQKAAFNMQYYN